MAEMTLEQVLTGLRAMKAHPNSLFAQWGDAIESAIAERERDVGSLATRGTPPEREEQVAASLALGAWMSAALDDSKVCDEMKRDINRWFDASMPVPALCAAPAEPVTDEEVKLACRKYYNSGVPVYAPHVDAMRAALESFASGRARVPDGEIVAWWNGIRKEDEHDLSGPTFSAVEDDWHDIPLYAGSNPCNAAPNPTP